MPTHTNRASNEVTSADGGLRVPVAFVALWRAAAEFCCWAGSHYER